MTPENLISHALVIVAQLAGPPLLAALLVGLTVGIMQTATQVNESSISFVAKLLAVIAALVVAGPYMTRTVVAYTRENIASLSEMVR